MADNKDSTKKKKTLSLKLGSKPMFAPKKNIEVGKTVIVERKRYKRVSSTDIQPVKNNTKQTSTVEKKTISINEKDNENKSSVVLKPLTKDEQKRIHKADNKKDKKDEIEKIRSGKSLNLLDQVDTTAVADTNTRFDNSNNKDVRKDNDKKKNSDISHEIDDRKKIKSTFGRKKIRERNL